MTVVEENLFWYQGEEPETFEDASGRCLAAIFDKSDFFDICDLGTMRRLLDQMISSSEKNDFLTDTGYAEYWKTLGAVTQIYARNLILNSGFIDVSEITARELLKVMVSKQRDYGHDNILRFGRIGLLVRVHDKIARLENLTRRGAGPENESLRDNYMDVINYCAIGMMVEMEWFQLELSEENKNGK
jgi:hypothetical protein